MLSVLTPLQSLSFAITAAPKHLKTAPSTRQLAKDDGNNSVLRPGDGHLIMTQVTIQCAALLALLPVCGGFALFKDRPCRREVADPPKRPHNCRRSRSATPAPSRDMAAPRAPTCLDGLRAAGQKTLDRQTTWFRPIYTNPLYRPQEQF